MRPRTGRGNRIVAGSDRWVGEGEQAAGKVGEKNVQIDSNKFNRVVGRGGVENGE